MAQVDYFLELDGIKGESKASKMEGKIQLESWSWSESNAGTYGRGGGGGAGKSSLQDFHFTKSVDTASSNLMLACAEGRHIKFGVLTARKAGKDQHDYLVFKFTDCLISAYGISGSANGAAVPSENFSVNFAKIEWAYKPQKADGTVEAALKGGWDTNATKKV